MRLLFKLAFKQPPPSKIVFFLGSRSGEGGDARCAGKLFMCALEYSGVYMTRLVGGS